MTSFLAQLRSLGWAVVEAAFLLIVLCVLLNIILGNESGPFIAGVAQNATEFLRGLPPGIFLGIVLIAVIYSVVRSRLQR